MGKSKIKVDSFVKLTIENSNLFGKVTALDEGKATISLPTGQTHSFETDKTDVEIIEQDEYNKEVRSLIEAMSKSIALDIPALEKQVADITKERDEANTALKVAQDQLASIEADKLAASRLAALKAVESVEVVDADEGKASAALKTMPKAEFDAIIKTATIAFKKLTEMRKTSLPALTDQSQTGLPKLTEAEQKAKDAKDASDAAAALAAAKVEDKPSLEGAANASEGASALEMLVSASVKSRHSKKNK